MQETQGIVMGKLRRKNQKSTGTVDAGKLREAIQQLCQAANPLGRSIDLVHQDLSNMGKELDHWRSEYRDAAHSYAQELKETEIALTPLYEKLSDITNKWDELEAKTVNCRARIIKNDVKIANLLDTVSFAAS